MLKQRAFHAPENLNKQQLAKYLVKPFKSDYEKIQVIAYWIASHIAYDGYKYNGNVNLKEFNYTYDTFKYRTGICTDYANLFSELTKFAGVKNVYTVTGNILENQTRIKRRYKISEFSPNSGHAWNEVYYLKRKFFVDTTYMSGEQIGWQHRKATASFRHKTDIKARKRKKQINTNINDFYFDFTPRMELKKYNRLHILDKYIEKKD